MSARDFSVRPVICAGELKAIERAVRSQGSLQIGSYVEVEFGATWGERQGKPFRVDGMWRQCRVVGHSGATVEVVFDPDPVKAPPDEPFG